VAALSSHTRGFPCTSCWRAGKSRRTVSTSNASFAGGIRGTAGALVGAGEATPAVDGAAGAATGGAAAGAAPPIGIDANRAASANRRSTDGNGDASPRPSDCRSASASTGGTRDGTDPSESAIRCASMSRVWRQAGEPGAIVSADCSQ